jgi:DNA-binding transcriptional LysR family regulator
VAVAEDGHIPRAAERLGMQQPLLSQRIKAIETELDVKLFRRKARGVELTEAGRVFFDRARAMIAQYEGSFEATRRRRAASRVGSDVGVMPTAPFHPFVPFVIRAFRAAFPLVSLTLDRRHSNDCETIRWMSLLCAPPWMNRRIFPSTRYYRADGGGAAEPSRNGAT